MKTASKKWTKLRNVPKNENPVLFCSYLFPRALSPTEAFLEKKRAKCYYGNNSYQKTKYLEMKSKTILQVPACISQEIQLYVNNHN